MREEWKKIAGQMKGIEERPAQALAYVREHAREGDPGSVLAALDDFAVNRAFLINVGPVKGKLLEREVKGAGKEARILELGCHCGYSAVLMAKHLAAAGSVTSIELSETSVQAARGIIEIAGLADRIEVIHGPSSDRIPTLEGLFDLVFLDHWKGLYRTDLEAIEAAGLLRKGSLVFADNVGPFFDAEDYLGYVRECGRFESRNVVSTVEYTDLEDAVEISIYRGT